MDKIENDDKLLDYLLKYINEYDKKIYSLELKIENRILDNINNIEIDYPLVFKRVCDFVKLKYIKDKITEELKTTTKIIITFELYNDTCNDYILNAKKRVKWLEDQLRLIDEDPKDYLRHFEAYNFDYSNVKSDVEREIIKCMLKELSFYKKMRKKLSYKYTSLELKMKDFTLNPLKLVNKNQKSS